MANNQFINVNISTLKKGTAVFAYTGTTIDKALAGDNSKLPFLGLLFADTANNAIGSPQRGGDFSATIEEWDYVLEIPTGTGLTANTEYWLSDAIAGKITPIKPAISANQIRVGYSISTTQISIDFRNINSSGDEVNSRIDSINTQLTASSQNVTGFENLTDSKMSFNNTTRVFTIEPNTPVTEYNIYRNAIKTTINIAKTITLPNTTNEYFIYFDSNNDLAYLNIFDPSLIFDDVYVAVIHYNASQAKMITDKPCDERHGISMSSATHYYAHKTIGAKWIEGLGLTGFTIDGDGSLDSHSQFTAESGSFADEDIVHIVPSYSQLAVFYRTGTEWKSKTADAFPFIYSGTVGYTGTRICFNENVAGNYQLTEVTNDYYILLHPYALNSKQVGVFLGVNQYATLEEARAGANVELSTFNGLPFQEFVKIGSVIVKCSNSFINTHKVATVSTNLGQNYVDFRRSSTLSIINAGSDHVHSQYLTEAQANTLYTTISDFTALETRVDTAETNITTLQTNSLTSASNLNWNKLINKPSEITSLSGVNTGDQTNITGNAGTATALQTARTINGVAFDGTSNITITAVAGSHASTHGSAGSDPISIDASQITSGNLSIIRGGTGATTQQSAINNILGLTTKGDLILRDNAGNNVRYGVGADSKILCADSTTNEGLTYKYICELLNVDKFSFIFDDFVGQGASWLNTTNGGASAGVFLYNVSNTTRRGEVGLQTGTTATGHANMTTNLQGFVLSNGIEYFEAKVAFSALATVAQDFLFRIGFGDQGGAVTTEHNNGLYWEYNRSNSTFWNYVTARTASRTRTPSATSVTTNDIKLGFLVNANASSVTFYINRVQVGTPVTTNIPTSAQLIGHNVDLRKTAGTTSVLAYIDYYVHYNLFTTR